MKKKERCTSVRTHNIMIKRIPKWVVGQKYVASRRTWMCVPGRKNVDKTPLDFKITLALQMKLQDMIFEDQILLDMIILWQIKHKYD